MLSARDTDGGVTGTILNDPLQYTVLSACTAVAWIFSFELILTILLTDRRRSGCYFWALLISSTGCIIHALGFVLKFLVGTSWLVDLAFIDIGWIAMVSGQSFVLWSRLNLVVRSKRILNCVLAAIIIDGLALHIPTLVFIYGANSPSAGRWINGFNIMERVQLVGFSIQEFAIGGIYIFATVKLLTAIYYPGTRRAMYQLLIISCLCLAMDVVLVALEFSNNYVTEASVKSLIYAIKLKLEYAVYSQLVGFTKAAFEDDEAALATGPPEGSGDIYSRKQYNSPAEFFKNIPGVLRKPPLIAPYPTIHTHPEQIMKADRKFGMKKNDLEWDSPQLQLSPSNAAAVLMTSGDGSATSIPRNMRLTAELIQNSLSYLNPLKERELDLRGHKIPTIENLGVAKDQDAIDFTDNDINAVSNFPLSPRLHTLLLARNRVNSIQPTLANSIPNLTTLVLTSNNVAELADLDPLRNLPRLTHLSLLENPVTRKEHYRYWIIWRCPAVRFLDYQKVKDAERKKATELFGTTKEPSALASKIMGIKSRTFDVPSTSVSDLNGAPSDGKNYRVKLTEKEKKRVEALIRNAKSLQEITRLEKELNEGRIPVGGGDEDRMEQ
ncbi:MAG: hypothetical protein Q9203_003133 [Teloschistes exilis]